MRLPKNHSGITLIALVITIIVMLILVGVTVSIAINGGLFEMAKEAKSQTEKTIAEENALAEGRVKMNGTWYDSMEDYVNEKPSKIQEGTYFTVAKNENGTVTENATYESGGYTAIIPRGFKVSEKEGEYYIPTGLVIQDAEGNEFVWVPVTYTATGELDEHELDSGFKAVFYRSDWSNNERTKTLDVNYTEPYANGYSGEDEDYYAMMKSVQENGGFYIGRYEAGSETPRTSASVGDTTMVVKRDQYPYIYVAWGNNMNDMESPISSSGHGAVYLSKHMYEEKDKVGVVSTLCYGVQWDAMLDFIKDEFHNVTDSTTWGNHKNSEWIIDRAEAKANKYENYELGEWTNIPSEGLTKTSSKDYLLTTGASDSFSAKNIYDVAGNCEEWTMEAYSTSCRAIRGGYYSYKVVFSPTSRRSTYIPDSTTGYGSFRPALYIKN